MSSPGFEYLNARVRAMAVDLLPAAFYEQVRQAEGIEPMVDALLASAYAPILREELEGGRGFPAIERAARRKASAAIVKVRAVAPPEAQQLLDVQFRFWDAANVLAVVRGIAAHAQVEEVLRAVFPAGALTEPRLAELAAQPGLAELASALTTWDFPLAGELRAALRDRTAGGGTGATSAAGATGGAAGATARGAGTTARGAGTGRVDIAALEAAISTGFFRWARAQVGPSGDNEEVLLGMLRRQIDLANVTMALDQARHRERGDPLEDRASIPGGRLGSALPREIARTPRLLDALALLGETYFAPAVERGMRASSGGGTLAAITRFLEGVVITAGCRLFAGDPLGVALPLGFLWRVYSEVVNLRVLARGKAYHMSADAIGEELVVA